MLLAYLSIFLSIFQLASSQSTRELDSLLQTYAFRSLVRPRTGLVYNATVPSNLTGIQAAALRLRSGSLRRKGFGGYREFNIPVGVIEQPYVERVIWVYHNLGNWSSFYYPLPGYTFLTPVLGLLAYDATDLTATNISELDIRVAGSPISIGFLNVRNGSLLSSPMCVYFGLDGSVGFENVIGSNFTCLTTNQGHYSIVVEQLVAPAPAPAGGSGGGNGTNTRVRHVRFNMSERDWIIVGSVVGGVILLALFVVLMCCVRKCLHRKKIKRMEDAAESGLVLPMTRVGNTKAPVAMETRTRPILENEFVP